MSIIGVIDLFLKLAEATKVLRGWRRTRVRCRTMSPAKPPPRQPATALDEPTARAAVLGGLTLFAGVGLMAALLIVSLGAAAFLAGEQFGRLADMLQWLAGAAGGVTILGLAAWVFFGGRD